MKTNPPPPIKVAKDKPYSFSGWTWKDGKWKPVFQEKAKAKQARKKANWEQSKRLAELDELMDHSIAK